MPLRSGFLVTSRHRMAQKCLCEASRFDEGALWGLGLNSGLGFGVWGLGFWV